MRKNFDTVEFLSDSFSMTGTDIIEFREVIEELTKRTKYRLVNTSAFEILTPGYKVGDGSKKRVFKVLNADTVKEFEQTYSFAGRDETVDMSDMCLPILEESLATGGFVIRVRGVNFYLGEPAVTPILARAGMSGDSSYRISRAKFLMLCESLIKSGLGETSRGLNPRFRKNRGYNATMVYRTAKIDGNEINKVVFMPSETYAPIPMRTITDIAEAVYDDDILGKPEVLGWYVDHGVSEITMVFPEAAKDIKSAYALEDDIIPGVIIKNSDTGENCIEAHAVAFIGKNSRHYVTLERYARKHSGDVDIPEVIGNINELLMRNVRVLPELLADLMGRNVYDGDLDSISGQKKNRKAVERLITDIFSSKEGCLNMTKALGKKREVSLRENLFMEINPEKRYMEYDVAIMVMTCGERIGGLSQGLTESLAKCVAKTPFALAHVRKETAEAEEIYLMPED